MVSLSHWGFHIAPLEPCWLPAHVQEGEPQDYPGSIYRHFVFSLDWWMPKQFEITLDPFLALFRSNTLFFGIIIGLQVWLQFSQHCECLTVVFSEDMNYLLLSQSCQILWQINAENHLIRRDQHTLTSRCVFELLSFNSRNSTSISNQKSGEI